MKILPISIRSLESIIRLSYAFAKLRLSKQVEIPDAINSLYLYLKAFYGGYENLSENFFNGYENLIRVHKEKMESRQGAMNGTGATPGQPT